MSFLSRVVCRPTPAIRLGRPPSHPPLRFFTSTPKPRVRPYPHRQYSSEKPPFLNFLDRIPKNTVFWGIICINGGVFIAWNLTKARVKTDGNIQPYKWMLDNFTTSWRNFSQGRIWTAITASFSHEDVGHILFNGFTFYFLGKQVLDFLGSRQFIFLYLGGGLVSSLTDMGWHNLIKHRDMPALGASGAVYSVISFLACVAPRMTFMLYGIIPVPAWLAVAGVFAYDSYSAVYDKQKGTAVAAHVGGLLSGMAYFLARRFRVF